MLLRNLEDVKDYFASLKGVFVGAGMTGFSRILPSYFVRGYRLLALRNTGDLALLRKRAELFCLEEETCSTIREAFDSCRLLGHPLAESYVKGLGKPVYILPYQSYRALEAAARERGWRLLANPAALRERVGGRGFFKDLTDELALRSIPGRFCPIDDVLDRTYDWWRSFLGNRFVLQLPEVAKGGGAGTFFVDSPSSYRRVRQLLHNRVWRGCRLSVASLRRFVEGTPASVALCLTKKGILASALQRQLIDLPFCGDAKESGIFCGHVWGSTPWASPLAEDALEQARKIGSRLRSLGCRGIVGIDFLLDLDGERAYPIEINPRLTGAFPMLSMLHMERGAIPMEAFHILEFLGLPYEADVDQLNEAYAQPVKGSHLLLFLGSGENRVAPRPPRAGCYALETDGTAAFQGEALDYGEMGEGARFLLADGPPVVQGEAPPSGDPLYRLCRLLFPYPVVDRQGGLLPQAAQAVRWAHRAVIRGGERDRLKALPRRGPCEKRGCP